MGYLETVKVRKELLKKEIVLVDNNIDNVKAAVGDGFLAIHSKGDNGFALSSLDAVPVPVPSPKAPKRRRVDSDKRRAELMKKARLEMPSDPEVDLDEALKQVNALLKVFTTVHEQQSLASAEAGVPVMKTSALLQRRDPTKSLPALKMGPKPPEKYFVARHPPAKQIVMSPGTTPGVSPETIPRPYHPLAGVTGAHWSLD